MTDYAQLWRSRLDIERDVLVALLVIPVFRARVLGRLPLIEWSTADHRRVAMAVVHDPPDPTPMEVNAWVANVLACNQAAAMEWVLTGNPVSYDHDVERLVATR